MKRAGVPVLPAGLRGTRQALAKGQIFPRPAACAMRIGAPIPAEEVLAPGRAFTDLFGRRIAGAFSWQHNGLKGDQALCGKK